MGPQVDTANIRTVLSTNHVDLRSFSEMLGVPAYTSERRPYSATLYPTSFTLDFLLALRICAQDSTHGWCFTSCPRAFFFLSFFNLTYSRWNSSLPSCLWSQRIFPSLPGSCLTIFYRDASSALLQLVNQWLDFTYSRSHAFLYEKKNTNPTLVRIELTTSALAGVQVTY